MASAALPRVISSGYSQPRQRKPKHRRHVVWDRLLHFIKIPAKRVRKATGGRPHGPKQVLRALRIQR